MSDSQPDQNQEQRDSGVGDQAGTAYPGAITEEERQQQEEEQLEAQREQAQEDANPDQPES